MKPDQLVLELFAGLFISCNQVFGGNDRCTINPELREHGKCVITKTEYFCRCDEGFELSVDKNSCVGFCTRPPELENAVTQSCARHIGAEVNITCKDGHVFPDGLNEKTVRCTSRRAWEPVLEHCINASALAKCGKGYELRNDHSPMSTCSFTRQRTQSQGGSPNCKRRSCEPLPRKKHATSGTFGELYYQDQVSYVCDHGYETKEKKSKFWATCNESGKWVFESASDCLRVTCPPLPTWIGLKVNTTDTSYRTTVNYTCEEGYYFADRWRYLFTTCGQDGRWEPEVIPCLKRKNAEGTDSPAEAPLGHVFGAAMISILASIGCFFLALDCLYLLRSKDNRVNPESES